MCGIVVAALGVEERPDAVRLERAGEPLGHRQSEREEVLAVVLAGLHEGPAVGEEREPLGRPVGHRLELRVSGEAVRRVGPEEVVKEDAHPELGERGTRGLIGPDRDRVRVDLAVNDAVGVQLEERLHEHHHQVDLGAQLL